MSDRLEEPASPLPPMAEARESSPSAPGRREPPETRTSRPPESPIAVILVGFFVGLVLGGFSILAGEASDTGFMIVLGYVLVTTGSVITSVGVVAAGVRLGMRWARIDDSRS